jgi:hypothetical protein
MREVKAAIRDVITEGRSESIERARGAVLFQGFDALLRALETERRLRDGEPS